MTIGKPSALVNLGRELCAPLFRFGKIFGCCHGQPGRGYELKIRSRGSKLAFPNNRCVRSGFPPVFFREFGTGKKNFTPMTLESTRTIHTEEPATQAEDGNENTPDDANELARAAERAERARELHKCGGGTDFPSRTHRRPDPTQALQPSKRRARAWKLPPQPDRAWSARGVRQEKPRSLADAPGTTPSSCRRRPAQEA